jgi:hypothetical protein
VVLKGTEVECATTSLLESQSVNMRTSTTNTPGISYRGTSSTSVPSETQFSVLPKSTLWAFILQIEVPKHTPNK